MDSHLGYEANDHSYKAPENRRNGYSYKNIRTTYGFEISHETISNITDRVVETADVWQNRPLKNFIRSSL